MHTLSVPVTNWSPVQPLDCAATLKELRRAGAGRVFLCVCRSVAPEAEKRAQLAALRQNIPFFERAGLEVGVWMSTLGHGGPLVAGGGAEDTVDFPRIVGLSSETCEDSFCPMDEGYAALFVDWVEQVARAGARRIMLDDDYRLAYRAYGIGCACEKHLARMEEICGERLSRAQLRRLAFSGAPNRYRAAWLKAQAESLIGLAKRCRARLNAIDPAIQLGFCACLSSWGVDGADAIALTRAFAGGAKPFLRTIGAPYWHVRHNWGARLGDIIELTRLQAHWCEDSGIELFAEGDVYPRPRFSCPAAYLECFDTALRAAGCLDGILKYVLDYVSSPRYETGYIDRMQKNRAAYAFIEKHFARGACAGAVPRVAMRRLDEADLPEECDTDALTDGMFFSMEQRLLANASIPMAYGGDGVRVAFGENARHIDLAELRFGLVTDAPGARILRERGVDTGVLSLRPSACAPVREHFLAQDEYVGLDGLKGFYEMEVSPQARVDSEFLAAGRAWPGGFRYKNLYVLAFDAFAARRSLGALAGNLRAWQIRRAIEELGKALPAACEGNPYLYVLAKDTPDGLALGLWNLFEDPACGRVRLNRAYQRVEACGAQARLVEGGTALELETEIPPWSFALFALAQ